MEPTKEDVEKAKAAYDAAAIAVCTANDAVETASYAFDAAKSEYRKLKWHYENGN